MTHHLKSKKAQLSKRETVVLNKETRVPEDKLHKIVPKSKKNH